MRKQSTLQTVSSSKRSETRGARPAPATHPLTGPLEMMGAPLTFGRNGEIYGEGEPADFVYNVVSGTVRTYKVLADGRRQIGAFYLPGDVFGLEFGDDHAFSAEAISESKILAETYHFHDLVNPGRHGAGAVAMDVRLSTAASNSARFPFVSPAGEIVPPGQSNPVDRIVDGGYLENFGVLSAFDLVNAMHALQPDLKPFVLVISNDPNMPVDAQEPPASVGAGYLSDITSFLWGVATTRAARASIGLVHLETLVAGQNAAPRCGPSLAHVRVWPKVSGTGTCVGAEDTAVISMSWWQSKPVQLRLVAELDQPSCNRRPFEMIWTALAQRHGCE
jgi:hypothetical protein